MDITSSIDSSYNFQSFDYKKFLYFNDIPYNKSYEYRANGYINNIIEEVRNSVY